MNITLCTSATPAPCIGGSSFPCPTLIIGGPDTIASEKCYPGFNPAAFTYTITVSPSGGCFGGAALPYPTFPCTNNPAADVLTKVGHGKF